MTMRIAVLGGGHGAYAAAADLAEQGHEIRLWRRDAKALAPLIESPSITLKDSRGKRHVNIALATPDIGAAIRGSELILIPGPAFAQADIAAAMAPHLAAGQVVFLPPGTFGSYAMARQIQDAGCNAQVTFAETGTLPYLARKHGPTEIAITIRAKRLPTGVFPARRSVPTMQVIRQAYPCVESIEDALSGALMNAGPIIHPPLITMNAGPIEHFEKWDIHKEGTQPAIRRVTDALDAERIAIREALGYGGPHFPLADHYSKDGEPWMYARDAHDQLTDSGDWSERLVLVEHRYMLEDLRLGLSFLASVAGLAGVQTPLVKAFLAIGSAITGQDFAVTGRSLSSLGLGDLDRAALQTLLVEGFR